MLTDDSLEAVALENLDLILNALGIEYSENGSRFFFPCPIHNSDNYNSMSIYKDKGTAICFTMGCMGTGKGILDFVGAVLKSNSYDEKDPSVFCENALRGISQDIRERVKPQKIDYRVKEVDRSLILPFVNPNIEFYLRRGYSKEILEKYDIFICKKRGNSMYGRITIPIYNDDHTKAVGFLGRSLNPQCAHCRKFHPSNCSCPKTPYEFVKSEKWLNSRGLARNKLLFNYWFAKDEIARRKEVILVESPGNAIKITQAGFTNVVAMFGTALSKNQLQKLDASGATTVYLGLDRDKAGENAAEKIESQLTDFRTIRLIPPVNDYGDMKCDEIYSFLCSKGVKL